MRRIVILCGIGTPAIALADSDEIVARQYFEEPRRFADNIVHTLLRLLDDCGWQLGCIDRISVDKGPGRFTGLRTGLSFARTLCQVQNIRAETLSSFDLLMTGIPTGCDTLAVTNLRANRVAICAFSSDTGLWSEARESAVEDIVVDPLGVVVTDYPEQLAAISGIRGRILARKVNIDDVLLAANIGASVDPEHADASKDWSQIKPLYIRGAGARENAGASLLDR